MVTSLLAHRLAAISTLTNRLGLLPYQFPYQAYWIGHILDPLSVSLKVNQLRLVVQYSEGIKMPRGAAAAAAGPKKGRGPKAHVLAEEFPCGLIIQDLCKKQWQLGNVVGQGGFGLIYLASEDVAKLVDKKGAKYVIKIEPKGNGPLYCEMQFYQRGAKLSQVQTYVKIHKLRYLGVPPFIATGCHTYKSKDYRFLVMPRLGTDLQQLLVMNGGTFASHATFAIGLRMVDALQFIHENEFVHADIKAANILLGYENGEQVPNEVYLVDYGLAYRYSVDGKHREYKEDRKRAHDGTIEFTSRDAHKGVAPSRRGDLEILGYCMLHWLCGKLPWEDNLSSPTYVAAEKEKYMANLPSLISACLPGVKTSSSECITSYLESVCKLKYDSTPDYNHLKNVLKTGMNKAGQKDEWKIEVADWTKDKKRKSTDLKSPVTSPKTKIKKTQESSPVKKPKVSRVSSQRAKKSPASKSKSKAVLQRAKASVPPKTKPVSPRGGKKGTLAGTKSPVAKKSPKATKLITPMTKGATVGGGRPRKFFPMPAPTKQVVSVTAKTVTSKLKAASTKRRVKRVTSVQSNACIQTSPGLLQRR